MADKRRTKIMVAALAGCILTACLMPAAAGESFSHLSLEWEKSAPLPEARAGYASGILDGKLVIVGGTYWDGSEGHWIRKRYTSSTHAFDPVRQRWERLPDLPIALGYGASTVVAGRLFVFGGYTGSRVNRKIFALGKEGTRYKWNVVGEMNADRVFAAAVPVKDEIYLIGGSTSFEAFDSFGTCCATNTVTNSILVYGIHSTTKKWRALSSYPGPARWMPGVASDGTSIWLFGGMLQSDFKVPVTNLDQVLNYNIARNEWQVVNSLPMAAANLQPITPLKIGKLIFLFTAGKRVWLFDLRSQLYAETTPMPEAVQIDQFFWLNHKIAGTGGECEVERPRRRSDWTFQARIRR